MISLSGGAQTGETGGCPVLDKPTKLKVYIDPKLKDRFVNEPAILEKIELLKDQEGAELLVLSSMSDAEDKSLPVALLQEEGLNSDELGIKDHSLPGGQEVATLIGVLLGFKSK